MENFFVASERERDRKVETKETGPFVRSYIGVHEPITINMKKKKKEDENSGNMYFN